MITDIQMYLEDKFKGLYTLEWKNIEGYEQQKVYISENKICDIYRDVAHEILQKLVEAQIGGAKVTKQTLVKYIRAKR